MLAAIPSAVLVGIDGLAVSVEVHVTRGLPSFCVVGLPDASCRESRDRVRAAVTSSGFVWPQKRVTVNLAPSGLRKAGAGLDLPIAIGLLVADGQLPTEAVDGCAFLGELGLDGAVRSVPGTMATVEAMPFPVVVTPAASVAEAQAIAGRRVWPATTLRSVVASLLGEEDWPQSIPPVSAGMPTHSTGSDALEGPDLADVRGQPVGRLAVEVAAAGRHHLLLCGPPGAGKSMLAERLPGLLPPLSTDHAMEVTRIHSAAGLPLPEGVLVRRPPFRAPHHRASSVSLVGGGTSRMRPGEISCAHRGVLFMDELAEFPADVLDTLRQPLEQGRVIVARAKATVCFPADFQLVAAMNPCPCGGDGGPGSCRCTEQTLARYSRRVSGPLLDRFDLRVQVDRPDVEQLLALSDAPVSAEETTATVAARVARARAVAASRGVSANAAIPGNRLDELAPLEPAATRLLETYLRQGRLSARGLHRVRRVARTLADLDGHEGPVAVGHVSTALALRSEPFAGPVDPEFGGRMPFEGRSGSAGVVR